MSRLQRVLHQLRWSVAVRGVSGTARLVVQRSLSRGGPRPVHAPHAFDLEHGVETSGRISGAELGGGHPHDVHTTAYLAIPPSRFYAAMVQWQALPGTRPIEEYAFVDIGCGKGRALLLASGMPFRECVGVELNPALAATAERNAAIWAAAERVVGPLRVVCADVLEAELPRSPMVLYLYNPFRGPVMRRLLERLEAHVLLHGGGLDLIYLVPEQMAEFAAFPHFVSVWQGEVAAAEDDVVAEGVAWYDACQIFRR